MRPPEIGWPAPNVSAKTVAFEHDFGPPKLQIKHKA
jgi:hypothetical protein